VTVLTGAAAPEGWVHGAFLLGVIGFVAAFLIVGRNWSLRQQALDLCGSARANRLAVFTSGLRLWVGDAPAGGEPLVALADFARRRPADIAAGRFRRLIVFGGPGSGKGPLGEALASEAALAEIDSGLSSPFRMPPPPGGAPRPETSRVISAEALLSIAERLRSGLPPGRTDIAPVCLDGAGQTPLIVYERADVRFNPTADLYAVRRPGSDAPLDAKRGAVTRDFVAGAEPLYYAADLVVVTDMRDGRNLKEIVAALAPDPPANACPAHGPREGGPRRAGPKQTVWLWEGVARAHLSDPAFPNNAEIVAVRDALAEALDVAHDGIAVALASRTPRTP
jgi:hypothetical protein